MNYLLLLIPPIILLLFLTKSNTKSKEGFDFKALSWDHSVDHVKGYARDVANDIINPVKDLVDEIVRSLAKMINQALGGIKNAINKIKRFPQVIDIVKNSIMKIINNVKKEFLAIINEIKDFFKQLMKDIGDVFDKIGGAFKSMGKVFEDIVDGIKKIPEIFEVFPKMFEEIKKFFEKIGKFFTEDLPKIFEIFPKIFEKIKEFIQKIGGVFKDIETGFKKVPQTFDKIGEKLKDGVGAIKKVGTGFKKIKEAFETVGDFFKDIGQTFIDFFQDALIQVIGIFGSLMGSLLDIGKTLVLAVWNTVSERIWFLKFIPVLFAFAIFMAPAMIILIPIALAFIPIIGTPAYFIPLLGLFLLPVIIYKVMESGINELLTINPITMVTDALAGAPQLAERLFTVIRGKIQDVLGNVNFTGVATDVFDEVKDVIDDVTDKIEDLGEIGEDMFGDIKQEFNNIVDKIKEIDFDDLNVFDDIKTELDDIMDKLTNFDLGDINVFDDIGSKMTGLVDQLKNIKDIDVGFLNDLTTQIQILVGKLSGLKFKKNELKTSTAESAAKGGDLEAWVNKGYIKIKHKDGRYIGKSGGSWLYLYDTNEPDFEKKCNWRIYHSRSWYGIYNPSYRKWITREGGTGSRLKTKDDKGFDYAEIDDWERFKMIPREDGFVALEHKKWKDGKQAYMFKKDRGGGDHRVEIIGKDDNGLHNDDDIAFSIEIGKDPMASESETDILQEGGNTLPTPVTHPAWKDGARITIKHNDSGKYLGYSTGGATYGMYPKDTQTSNNGTIWKLQYLGQGKYGLYRPSKNTFLNAPQDNEMKIATANGDPHTGKVYNDWLWNLEKISDNDYAIYTNHRGENQYIYYENGKSRAKLTNNRNDSKIRIRLTLIEPQEGFQNVEGYQNIKGYKNHPIKRLWKMNPFTFNEELTSLNY